jgi:uncharacterized membrane protein
MTPGIVETVWNAMGWCPMHAAPRHTSPGSEKDLQQRDLDAGRDPVARRSSRLMRTAWGIVILSWIFAFLVLPHLPEIFPIHWGLHGEPDGFADRFTGTLGLPVIITITMIILIIIPRFDSVQVSLAPFRDSYAIVILATVSMLFCIEVMTLAIALGISLPVVTIVPMLIGILFIVIGSMLPQIGRNTTIGIRFPWTLASEEVWKKTHDFGGRLFQAAGVIVVLGSLVAGVWAVALMLVLMLGTTLFISIWSYRLSKRVANGQQKTYP